MNFYTSLPFLFLKFYFLDGPKALIVYFVSLNSAFLQFFSLPLLVKTFFKPWKNEYRKGLVATAIGLGIVIKSIVILADLCILIALLVFEILCVLVFLSWPIATIGLLFWKT